MISKQDICCNVGVNSNLSFSRTMLFLRCLVNSNLISNVYSVEGCVNFILPKAILYLSSNEHIWVWKRVARKQWFRSHLRETQCNTSVDTTLVSTFECDRSLSGVLNPKGNTEEHQPILYL